MGGMDDDRGQKIIPSCKTAALLLSPFFSPEAKLVMNNFHQKNNNGGGAATAPPAFELPACVTKACTIMEAVADLNSSNFGGFREPNSGDPITREHFKEKYVIIPRRESGVVLELRTQLLMAKWLH
ncbi:hypothetical protein L2E82_11234 [Cichorium intybus]|uniref:Uncharacterized protein n=1 Tax=Cichorium intybus TaxID=13427 RepID=A0ACB9GDS3_CICIN|nr:hypothetical protein L2E82_11234 [Cichorium intybus]